MLRGRSPRTRARPPTPSPCAARRRSRTRSGRAPRRPRRARRRCRPRARRAPPAARRARRGTAARASRPRARRRGRAPRAPSSRSSRPSASSAWRRRRVELRVAAGVAPPLDAGERGVGRLPVARVERVLGDGEREPAAAASGSDAELAVRRARDLERLGGCGRPGAAPRSGSRRPRRCPAAGRARSPCRARVRSAAAPSSISPVAASDTPSALSAPAASRWPASPDGSSACSASERRATRDRAVVARLEHQHPRLLREQPGALGARPVVGEQREPAVERRDRLVRLAASPTARAAAARR